MVKNPFIMAVAGLLVGLFVGYVIGQGQPGAAPAAPSPAADPHAGVPGAPPLPGSPSMPPEGGRTLGTANPRLLEQVRDLEALLAQDPDNYQHLVQMGNLQYDLANFLKAADYYEKARKIQDDSADVLTDLGVAYKETGRPQLALELFDRAADMEPRHWQSRYNAVVVRLFDLGDAAGAQDELEKLKTLRAANPDLGIPDPSGLEQEIAKRRK